MTPKSVGKAQAKPVGGAARPSPQVGITCPFTNEPIVIKTVGPDAHVMGVGPFYSTRIFESRQELVNALMTRNGVQPPWAKRNVTVSDAKDNSDDDSMSEVEKLKKDLGMAADIK